MRPAINPPFSKQHLNQIFRVFSKSAPVAKVLGPNFKNSPGKYGEYLYKLIH